MRVHGLKIINKSATFLSSLCTASHVQGELTVINKFAIVIDVQSSRYVPIELLHIR